VYACGCILCVYVCMCKLLRTVCYDDIRRSLTCMCVCMRVRCTIVRANECARAFVRCAPLPAYVIYFFETHSDAYAFFEATSVGCLGDNRAAVSTISRFCFRLFAGPKSITRVFVRPAAICRVDVRRFRSVRPP